MSKKFEKQNQTAGASSKSGLEFTKDEQSNRNPHSGKGFNGNGRRGGRRGGRGFNSSETRKGKMFNDVSWYNKNKVITDAFGKLPFSFITGAKIPNGTGKRLRLGTVLSYGIDWLASPQARLKLSTDHIDINLKGTSIVDQIKTILYTDIRRANSGSKNDIEPIDVMMSNLLASIDIICNTVYIARIFKIVNTFSWRNRTIPQEMFYHMGLNYDDFVANQSNYRGRFDTLVAYAKTIRTLAKYPFIQAIYSEFMNIFKDEDTDTGREQFVISVKPFHHIYDAKGTEQHPGGCVRLMTWEDDFNDGSGTIVNNGLVLTTGYGSSRGSTAFAFSHLLGILEKQIKALVENPEFNLIQADLEKAFGNSGYWEPAAVDIDVASGIVPIYSGEFNTMFKHGTFFPMPGFYNDGIDPGWCIPKNVYANNIYQQYDEADPTVGTKFVFDQHICDISNGDGGAVFDEVATTWSKSNPSEYMGGFVDTDVEDPSPDDNIIFTRFKNYVVPIYQKTSLPADMQPSGTVKRIYFLNGSNFVVFGGMLSYVDYVQNNPTMNWVKWTNMISRGYSDDQFQVAKSVLASWKNSPILYDFTTVGTVEAPTPRNAVNNIRFTSIDEIASLNEACFLSLWNLPDKTTI